MLFGSVVSVSAAEVSPDTPITQEVEESISTYANSFPYTSYANALPINTSWKTIATSTTGFNGHVRIYCRNISILSDGSVAKGIVRLLDKNGNVLWTSSDASSVPGQGSYSYWCGSDVYKIQIKTQAGGGSAWTQWES